MQTYESISKNSRKKKEFYTKKDNIGNFTPTQDMFSSSLHAYELNFSHKLRQKLVAKYQHLCHTRGDKTANVRY
jgi:hypothetical protein